MSVCACVCMCVNGLRTMWWCDALLYKNRVGYTVLHGRLPSQTYNIRRPWRWWSIDALNNNDNDSGP